MATQVPGRSACQAALRVSNEAAPGLCSRVRACRGGWFGHRLLAAEVPWCRDGAHRERRRRERMASRHDAMYEDRMLRGQWPQATAKYLRWRRFSRPSPPVAAAPGRARGTCVVDALRRAEAGPDRPAQDGGGVAAIPVRVLWGRPERPCGFPGPRRRIPAACAAFGDTGAGAVFCAAVDDAPSGGDDDVCAGPAYQRGGSAGHHDRVQMWKCEERKLFLFPILQGGGNPCSPLGTPLALCVD